MKQKWEEKESGGYSDWAISNCCWLTQAMAVCIAATSRMLRSILVVFLQMFFEKLKDFLRTVFRGEADDIDLGSWAESGG